MHETIISTDTSKLKPRASLNRCDQCAKKRKGCDRTYPTCDNCEKGGIKCTY
ncbi:hypothetical protein K502DRAFT_297650, partial [Neoconidiobolus thromboides FSU 785]